MHKTAKGLLIILALLAIYFVAQSFTGVVIGGIAVVSSMMSGGIDLNLDIAALTEQLTAVILSLTPWIVLSAIVIAVPTSYLLYKNRRQELLTFVRVQRVGAISIPMLILMALSINVMLEVALGFLSEVPAFGRFFEQYGTVEGAILGGGFTVSLIAIGIAAPIFEELLFRGLIFGELRKIMTVRLAIVVQAALFGAFHLNVVQGTYAFIIGLLLGFIYYRSNSIIAPIIIHISINASTVLLGQFVTTEQMAQAGGIIVIAAVALFFLTGAYVLLSKTFRRTMDDSLYTGQHIPGDLPPSGTDGQAD